MMVSASRLSLLVVAVAALASASAASAQLSSTFYDTSCPNALSTIKSAVTTAVNNEARMGASLLRLHFHDCFVDASFQTLALAWIFEKLQSHVVLRHRLYLTSYFRFR
jgi:peroxidase